MKTLYFMGLLLCGAVQAEPVLEIFETRIDESVARLRLLAAGELDFASVEPLFDRYCAEFAADLLREGAEPEQIVISISDRPVPFGETIPEAVQFFELYDLVEGACVWRGF